LFLLLKTGIPGPFWQCRFTFITCLP